MADAKTLVEPISTMPQIMNIKVPHIGAGLERGTSQYYSLCAAISQAALPFLGPRSRIVDLSARGGDWSASLIGESCFLCRFLLFNATEEQKDHCLGRFRTEALMGNVQEYALDLHHDFPDVVADLTLCVCALGEMDQERRDQVLESVHRHLGRMGALLLVEELDPAHGRSGKQWERELAAAGFSRVREIWHSGRYAAWMAER